MRRLDESAVAATAGEIADVMWIGKVCCNLIAACERVGDVERATQWCAEVKEFARRWELRTLFNTCRTQYAAVLLQGDAWDEAEAELEAAVDAFAGGRRAALFEGTAQLGELRRRQGRLDEARALFGRSELSRTARIGSVELALDEGDPATALALAERLDRATEKTRPTDRVAVLRVLVRAAVECGRVETALAAAGELDRLAEDLGTTRAKAVAARAGGEAAYAAGDLELARRRLEDAVDLFGLCESPYERARARLVLARVLARLGSAKRATSEARAARKAFRELDAGQGLAEAARSPRPAAGRDGGRQPVDPARAGGARARRRGPVEPGDRGRARRERTHRAPARGEHPAQARGADPCRRRGACDARRARLSAGAWPVRAISAGASKMARSREAPAAVAGETR